MSQELLADVKDALKEVVTRFAAKKNTDEKKQLVFQQKQMLLTAGEFLNEKPWITYFAAVKHIFFLKSLGITSSNFDSFTDKEYAQEVDRYAEKLAHEAEVRIDSDTQRFLQELILLQQTEPLIPQTIRALVSFSQIPLKEQKTVLFSDSNNQPPVSKLFSPKSSKHKWSIKFIVYVVKTLAGQLGQAPEDWLHAPDETIAYLRQLTARRPVLEATYLEI